MPGFESIKDQDKPVRLLVALLRKGALPHALLFSGIGGIGKQTAATVFAMACNCLAKKTGETRQDENQILRARYASEQAIPCGACKSCRKIESDNHPDIIRIKPIGPYIRIAQIRELCHILAMKPYEASFRVVIISDAQAMNPEAGNALLKVLEEPPDGTLLILTALQATDLLPTIVSRCQHIHFQPISRHSLERLLVEEHGLPINEAGILAIMANGSISKALELRAVNWINRRNWLIESVESLALVPTGALLAFAEMLAKNKELLSDSLEVIKVWLRDLVIWKYAPDKITNRDLKEKIQHASKKHSIKSTLAHIDSIQVAQRQIQGNANVRLALEVMALELAKVEAD